MMKNTDFIIYIETTDGWVYQTLYKENKQWYLFSTGTENEFKCTAEQVLNHMLPALLENRLNNLHVRVTKK